MKKIKVNTGFGYFTDINGHIVCKAQLPAAKYDPNIPDDDQPTAEYDLNIPDDYQYIEVRDQTELDAIKIYSDPADVQDGIYKDKIKKKIRQTAIDQLIADGELPADYKD